MKGQEPLYDAPDFRAFMAALEEEWPQRQTALRLSGVPLNDEPDPEPDPEPVRVPSGETPPWGDDFDPERAWNTIKRLRDGEGAEIRSLRAKNQELADRLKEIDDKDKSELEREQEARTSAEQRAAAAEAAQARLDIAFDKAPEGMSIAQVRKLAKRLTGSTKEELEADAEELFAEFAPESGQEPAPGRRPTERLRPGAAPGAEPEETDPAKLAAMVPRRP